jgi:hypothetical protein
LGGCGSGCRGQGCWCRCWCGSRRGGRGRGWGSATAWRLQSGSGVNRSTRRNLRKGVKIRPLLRGQYSGVADRTSSCCMDRDLRSSGLEGVTSWSGICGTVRRVRWVGPETSRAGAALRPGDRAVVIDSGRCRHHVTSFSSPYTASGTKGPRPGRGVTVRLHGSTEVTVPRRRLELLPPDHPLAPEPDGEYAAWWHHQLEPWGAEGIPVVGAIVPSSFRRCARCCIPGSDRTVSRSAGTRWPRIRASPSWGSATRPATGWCRRSRHSRAYTARPGSWMRSSPAASSTCSAAPPRHRRPGGV